MKFNEEFPSRPPIPCPLFEEVQKLSLADQFCDMGGLTHPGEPWAVDPSTREGIRSYLDFIHARDEISRIGRECRQAMKWAFDIQERLSALLTALELEGLIFSF